MLKKIRELRAAGARETDERAGVAREAEEIADNSEEDAAVAFATRAGGARETDKIAGEGEAIRDKIDEVVIEETCVELIGEAIREAAERS